MDNEDQNVRRKLCRVSGASAAPYIDSSGQYVIVEVNLRRDTILRADHVSRRESSGLEAAVTAKVSRYSGQ